MDIYADVCLLCNRLDFAYEIQEFGLVKQIIQSREGNMRPCPNCKSMDCKKASLIHDEGSSSTLGGGISLSGGIGVGAATTKSNLAKKWMPPVAEQGFSANSGINILIVAIGVAVLNAVFSGGYPSWVLFTVAALVVWNAAYKRWKKNADKRHERALETYQNTFVCLRCGEGYSALD